MQKLRVVHMAEQISVSGTFGAQQTDQLHLEVHPALNGASAHHLQRTAMAKLTEVLQQHSHSKF